MTRIWLVNWHFQSRITLWCRHKSTNVSMGLCWQMPKFIVWRLWSIYFDHHLPLKPSIGKRRKQSCTPHNNGNETIFYSHVITSFLFLYVLKAKANSSQSTSWCPLKMSLSRIAFSDAMRIVYTWHQLYQRAGLIARTLHRYNRQMQHIRCTTLLPPFSYRWL